MSIHLNLHELAERLVLFCAGMAERWIVEQIQMLDDPSLITVLSFILFAHQSKKFGFILQDLQCFNLSNLREHGTS